MRKMFLVMLAFFALGIFASPSWAAKKADEKKAPTTKTSASKDKGICYNLTGQKKTECMLNTIANTQKKQEKKYFAPTKKKVGTIRTQQKKDSKTLNRIDKNVVKNGQKIDNVQKGVNDANAKLNTIDKKIGEPKNVGDTVFSLLYEGNTTGKETNTTVKRVDRNLYRTATALNVKGLEPPAGIEKPVNSGASDGATKPATDTGNATANNTASAKTGYSVADAEKMFYDKNYDALCGIITEVFKQNPTNQWVAEIIAWCAVRAEQKVVVEGAKKKKPWYKASLGTLSDIFVDGPLCHLGVKQSMHGQKCDFNPVMVGLDYLTWRAAINILPANWQDKAFGKNPPAPYGYASGPPKPGAPGSQNGSNPPNGPSQPIQPAPGNDVAPAGSVIPGYNTYEPAVSGNYGLNGSYTGSGSDSRPWPIYAPNSDGSVGLRTASIASASSLPVLSAPPAPKTPPAPHK